MTDPMSDGGDGQQRRRQCRRGIVTPDVELGAALALADMAAGSSAVQAQARLHTAGGAEEMTDDEEMASTRLSLQLGRVGVHQSPSCSSSSSAGRPSAAPGGSGAAAHHGPRPRHMLTEVMTSLPPPPPSTNSACRLLLISCMGRRRSYLGAPID